jgi:imidazolonepropionase
MGLTFEEAVVGATINAAYALDCHDRVGSLEAGKQMDAVLVAGPAIDVIHIGADTIRAVIRRTARGSSRLTSGCLGVAMVEMGLRERSL